MIFLVVFPIVTGGAALIFTAGIVGTSILPTVAAGGLGLLGIGTSMSKILGIDWDLV